MNLKMCFSCCFFVSIMVLDFKQSEEAIFLF